MCVDGGGAIVGEAQAVLCKRVIVLCAVRSLFAMILNVKNFHEVLYCREKCVFIPTVVVIPGDSKQ